MIIRHRRRRTGQAQQSAAKPVQKASTYKPWAGTELGDWLTRPVGPALAENLEMLKRLSPTGDTRMAEFSCLGGRGPRAAVVFIVGLTDLDALESNIVRRLQSGGPGDNTAFAGPPGEWLAAVAEQLVPVSGHQQADSFEQVMDGLGGGKSVLFLDGAPGALLFSTQGWKERAVESPHTETTVYGPNVGFSENLQTNLALIRRYVQDPTLRIDLLEVGVRSKTRVAVVYLEAIARPALVEEIKRRLRRIDVDHVLGANHIGELLHPGYRGPFALHIATERPDRVVYKLYYGKVAILIDGTPEALHYPSFALENLLSMDDLYSPAPIASFLRLLRSIAWLIVVFVPALYVAVMAHNPGVVRVEMAMALAGSRVGVPLNVVAEVLLMEVMMDLLHEATIRLPSKIGSAATVVGGLIIGQAATAARLVSNMMLVVVAMTAVASFAFPIYQHGVAWRLVKWLNVIAATLLGIFGIFIAFTAIIVYLNALESFGVPYLTPVSPLLPGELVGRQFSRGFFWRNNKRPESLLPREAEDSVTGEQVRP